MKYIMSEIDRLSNIVGIGYTLELNYRNIPVKQYSEKSLSQMPENLKLHHKKYKFRQDYK